MAMGVEIMRHSAPGWAGFREYSEQDRRGRVQDGFLNFSLALFEEDESMNLK